MRLNEYLRERFGDKVYKISLNGGFTCPNRDGTIGYGGCIFCSLGGSGEFAEDPELSITDQIEKGRLRIAGKTKTDKYIAYFQAYTGTYGDINTLEALYTEAINHPKVVALSIATRPDCLPFEVLLLLERLNKIKPVWVELGLQTIHESSAEYIRRGYELSVFEKAMRELSDIGIETIVHVILGLPGEGREEMLETVKYVCDSGAKGIKLQLLHVLKGTDLQKNYEKGLVKVFTEDEYIELLRECVKIIPESVVIHRLTGDGDKRLLIAPMWSANKKRVINRIQREVFIR